MGVIEIVVLVASIFVGLLVTAGFGVLALTPADFKIARRCFWLAAIIMGGMGVMWNMTTDQPLLTRLVVTGLIGAVTLAGLSEALRWVRTLDAQQTQKTPPVVEDKRMPLTPSPSFTEIPGPFRVVVGAVTNNLTNANTRDRPSPMMLIGNQMMFGYIENGKVYVNVNLLGDDNNQVVTIRGNEFTSPPPNWDRNFDASALEIVDGNLQPRFQLIYRDNRTVIINGLFPAAGLGVVVMADGRMAINPKAPIAIRRIFKYPSRQYLGQENTSQ